LLFTLFPLSPLAAGETAWGKEGTIATEILEAAEAILQNSPVQGRIREIFPDENLAEVIANLFGVPVNSVVRGSDLARIVAFNAENRGIRNLAGMQYLSALREVNLGSNQIQSLSSLSGLRNLERLLLDDNAVQDLHPLSGLENLRWLWLDRNHVQNIRPLANLTNLEWLTLWDNQVEEIESLSRLTNLNALWLGDNDIRNIRSLEQLTELETLMLVHNQIGDLRPLYGLNRMETLWIGRQDITMPQLMRENPFEMANILRTPSGASIRPETISGNGSYHTPHIRWTGVTEAVYQVSLTFDQPVHVGGTTERFYGTLTQPLSATPFQDVRRSNWFYHAVAFVFHQDLMSGTSGISFAPTSELSRAMLVTILWRMAGEPAASIPHPFLDVPENAWFAEAAAWASERRIVQGSGSSDIFAPTMPVTREQFALMLHRFAGEPAPRVMESFNLNSYADYAEISSWAMEAMYWAVYYGFISGARGNMLLPRQPTNRAESAVILMRYVNAHS